MPTLNLTHQEVEMIKKSIDNCLKTCHQGGASGGCPDCQSLQQLLTKL